MKHIECICVFGEQSSIVESCYCRCWPSDVILIHLFCFRRLIFAFLVNDKWLQDTTFATWSVAPGTCPGKRVYRCSRGSFFLQLRFAWQFVRPRCSLSPLPFVNLPFAQYLGGLHVPLFRCRNVTWFVWRHSSILPITAQTLIFLYSWMTTWTLIMTYVRRTVIFHIFIVGGWGDEISVG